MYSINSLVEQCLKGNGISSTEAIALADESIPLKDLMHGADRIRRRFFGNKIRLCSIVNAKSGLCRNDCVFCAQSAHYSTGIQPTDVISTKRALEASREAANNSSSNFGIVTSGAQLDGQDMGKIVQTAAAISADGKIGVCASLGELDDKSACMLFDAGVRTYHHNLETSEKYYPQICSTYDYRKKIQTIKTAKAAGLRICCGGLFGLGETWQDRIDLAMAIQGLSVSSIPVNFLMPIKGTPLELRQLLLPKEALRIIAVYRFIFPNKTIKVCGGREHVLRNLQSRVFYAGANGTMIGNYLTTAGRPPKEDLQMLRDLGFEPSSSGDSVKC